MAALTETEARTRTGLLDVESYDVFLDLTTRAGAVAERNPVPLPAARGGDVR